MTAITMGVIEILAAEIAARTLVLWISMFIMMQKESLEAVSVAAAVATVARAREENAGYWAAAGAEAGAWIVLTAGAGAGVTALEEGLMEGLLWLGSLVNCHHPKGRRRQLTIIITLDNRRLRGKEFKHQMTVRDNRLLGKKSEHQMTE